MEKGKLKIFFGYSAGVGKTYAMLECAQQLKADGVDVVIGYVEPHDRPETAKLTVGLECLPLKEIEYKGITLKELDIDAAIMRRPQILIVDELAHTNAEGSRNRKRYIDVEELVNNGINVYTTVNVQHIEGMRDLVNSGTAVEVNELIPDEIFDLADEVVLVDIEPEALIERMREGKIYKKGRVSIALENFFQGDKLSALRELFMRRSADRIERKTNNGELKTKILVLISPSPSSEKNIRVAARMAEAYHCRFSAMYVERGGELTDEAAASIKKHMSLVRNLGGEMVVEYRDDVVEAVASYVKIAGVTNLILGKTWQSVGKKVGLEDKFIARLPEIEILIIPDSHSSVKIKRGVKEILAHIFKSDSSSKAQISNWTLDIVQLLAQVASRENKEEQATEILARAFERTTALSINDKVYAAPKGSHDIALFQEENELAVAEWCRVNKKSAGRGTDTLRGAKAIYYPIQTPKGIAVIAFCCIDRKLTVTEKLIFHQLENVLKLVL